MKTGEFYIGKCPECGSEELTPMYDGTPDENNEVEVTFTCQTCTHIFSVKWKWGVVVE